MRRWIGVAVSVFLVVLAVDFLLINPNTDIPTARADVERQTNPPNENLAALVAGNTEFAFDLYHQLVAQEDGNLIFSPYSISLAFAMLYAGAEGETAAQIAQTMHFTLPQEQLHPAFNALDLILQPLETPEPTPTPLSYGDLTTAEEVVLTVHNSVWGQKDFAFQENYLRRLALNYGAGVNLVDFIHNPQDAQQTISQWVEETTQGRITNVPPLEAITLNTRLVLINTIYFKGEWKYPFRQSETYEGAFQLMDGTDETVTLMVNDFAYMQCARGENFHAVELSYGASEDAAMLIILPDEGEFQEFENTLNAATFAEMRDKLRTTNLLTFTIPRFNFQSQLDLKQSLSGLGMPEPFNSTADFSGITPDSGLTVDYAVHQANISVDEYGTEAAGLTGVVMLQSALFSECESPIVANRPFIFAIYDRQTSTILFMGRVMNPAE